MVGKCCVGKEGPQKVEDVCRIQEFEQGLSQGFLPTPEHRLLG